MNHYRYFILIICFGSTFNLNYSLTVDRDQINQIKLTVLVNMNNADKILHTKYFNFQILSNTKTVKFMLNTLIKTATVFTKKFLSCVHEMRSRGPYRRFNVVRPEIHNDSIFSRI